MATISGRIQLATSFSQQVTGVPTQNSQSPQVSIPIAASFSPDGSVAAGAANGVDLKYTATLTFTTATPQILDLKSLLDVLGGAVAFARVRSITLNMHAPTDGNTLKLGYATTTTNAWVSLVTNPGQIILQACPTSTNAAFATLVAPNATGWVVGASNKLLNLDPGSFTGTYTVDIEITGCSA